MLAKRFFYVCAGFLCLALAFHLGARAATAQAPVPRPTSAGRYAIVNGTPDISINIMLLDTFTGESWVSCTGVDGERTWCKIIRSSGSTSGKDGK